MSNARLSRPARKRGPLSPGAYGEVGDEAQAKSVRRRGRSRRGSTAFRQPTRVPFRVGEAAPRQPEPLELRGWHLSVLPPQLLGLHVAGDDLGDRGCPPVACSLAITQRVLYSDREGRYRKAVR